MKLNEQAENLEDKIPDSRRSIASYILTYPILKTENPC